MHPHHKIIITGTGRAGTTFLVRLLTALNQPTGYDRESWRGDYFPHCAAGLEHDLTDPGSPYIVKDPELCVTLPGILARGEVVVDHAIVPVRELNEAALSRVRIGGAHGNVPGGLIGTDSPRQQRSVLAERFHLLIHALVTREIPHTFLLFPRFVRDPEYAFAKLQPIFPAITWPEFNSAFRAIADPSLIHSFSGPTVARAEGTASFQQAENRKRRARRVRRLGGWTAFAAATLTALAFRVPTEAGRMDNSGHRQALPSTRSVLAEDAMQRRTAGVQALRDSSATKANRIAGPMRSTPILLQELTSDVMPSKGGGSCPLALQ